MVGAGEERGEWGEGMEMFVVVGSGVGSEGVGEEVTGEVREKSALCFHLGIRQAVSTTVVCSESDGSDAWRLRSRLQIRKCYHWDVG